MKEFVKRYDDRTWAIICYVSFSIAFVSAVLFRAELFIFSVGVLVFMLISLVAGWVLVKSDAHRVMNEPSEKLDEREIDLRNRAFRLAYIGLAGLVSLVLIYWYIAADSGKFWLPSGGTEIAMTFWGVWWVLFTLPDAVCAYITPPKVADEWVEERNSLV